MLANVFKNAYIRFNFSKFSGDVPNPLVNSAVSQPRCVRQALTPPPQKQNLNARHLEHSSPLTRLFILTSGPVAALAANIPY